MGDFDLTAAETIVRAAKRDLQIQEDNLVKAQVRIISARNRLQSAEAKLAQIQKEQGA